MITLSRVDFFQVSQQLIKLELPFAVIQKVLNFLGTTHPIREFLINWLLSRGGRAGCILVRCH